MFRQAGYVVGSLGLAVAMLSFVIGMEMQVATARTGPEAPMINRALKGDRLPLMPNGSATKPLPRAGEPALPEGCVASYSSAKDAFSLEVPGRCVAAMPGLPPAIG